MTLEEYRKTKGLSYESLARLLGFTTSKTHRICQDYCVKLPDANVIIFKTKGLVDWCDLLPDGCGEG